MFQRCLYSICKPRDHFYSLLASDTRSRSAPMSLMSISLVPARLRYIEATDITADESLIWTKYCKSVSVDYCTYTPITKTGPNAGYT